MEDFVWRNNIYIVYISGCTCATLLTIFILIFIFLVKRICIAIELIKEASR